VGCLVLIGVGCCAV
ncbi:hypothetical protein A2U01_0048827, partial [Trifolium medium]|nr:hypothetical protein [Trifolium medium]